MATNSSFWFVFCNTLLSIFFCQPMVYFTFKIFTRWLNCLLFYCTWKLEWYEVAWSLICSDLMLVWPVILFSYGKVHKKKLKQETSRIAPDVLLVHSVKKIFFVNFIVSKVSFSFSKWQALGTRVVWCLLR